MKNMTDTPGSIPMPADFRYKKVLARGKPQHPRTDIFRIRHPSMAVSRRAKIFAPFDALKGFSEAVAAKDELYESRRGLSEEDLAELNRRMNILRRLTLNTRMVRANPVTVSVTYYVPCKDVNSDSFGLRGQYRTVTGICRKVDPDVSRSILVGDTLIPFRDIYRIEHTSDISWDE